MSEAVIDQKTEIVPETVKAAVPATSVEVTKTAVEPAAKPEPTKVETATPQGAPETYTLVADPTVVSADALKAVEAEAKALGLSNEQAQTLLNGRVAAVAKAVETFTARLMADTLYGGTHLPETQRYAEAALDRFAPKGTPYGDELRTIMLETGFGQHPAIVAFIAQIGKAGAEDHPVTGSGHAPEKVDQLRAADRAYINSTSAHLAEKT
jgi:hypothetical protein